jgi:hypothetical protein
MALMVTVVLLLMEVLAVLVAVMVSWGGLGAVAGAE